MTSDSESIAAMYSTPPQPHDKPIPPSFQEFMKQGWLDNEPMKVHVPAPEIRQTRRDRISEAFPNSLVLIPAGNPKVRSNDFDFKYRPHSDYVYSVGYVESDAVLALVPRANGSHDNVLLLRRRKDHRTQSFYTDRRYGELWTGAMPSFHEIEAATGIRVAALEQEIPRLHKLFPEAIVQDGIDWRLDKLWSGKRGARLSEHLSNLRLIKDEYEISVLRRAVDATCLGFEKVAEQLRNGYVSSERDVEVTFDAEARRHGNAVGYDTIVGAAKNATTLHWTRNNGPLPPKSLVLIDAGVEDIEFYTADVTRTLPVGGIFSNVQAELYEIVRKAQIAAISHIKPGRSFSEPHQAAMELLAQGLVDLGILKCSTEEALDPERQYYRRYTLHSTSHMLGLDCHDCAHASLTSYGEGILAPGHVLTAEPGVYFQPNDETVPLELRGIGIRIEDDILVTDTGNQNMSESLPSSLKDIEEWLS